MHFQEFKVFLDEKMKMSHIYQPVMIKKLLSSHGVASDLDIAGELLKFDPSQIEYYQKITNNMVGKVLRSHNIVEKDKSTYHLVGFDALDAHEIDELKKICEQKIDSYIKKRGDAIWNHRRVNRAAVPGSIRYEVLKRAGFRCELCGISADEKALEVDHITPKNSGGEDSVNNYQALCYSCNATKRDKDDTDFREIRHIYSCRDKDCLFCNIGQSRLVAENNLSYTIEDKFPVTDGHCMIIPKRHFAEYFQIMQPELNAVNDLVQRAKIALMKKDNSITGFNIGINSGEDAGQTIMHTHLHLIPRRKNDVTFPRGGIRNVIPGKGSY
ncbi:MAG: HIT domain-containing protein [Bacteroidota bacterium]